MVYFPKPCFVCIELTLEFMEVNVSYCYCCCLPAACSCQAWLPTMHLQTTLLLQDLLMAPLWVELELVSAPAWLAMPRLGEGMPGESWGSTGGVGKSIWGLRGPTGSVLGLGGAAGLICWKISSNAQYTGDKVTTVSSLLTERSLYSFQFTFTRNHRSKQTLCL